MIRIVADNYVKPEEKANYLKLAAELAEASRKELGNISYHLHQDKADENHLTFIEEWQDEEAIRLHNASAHFTTLVPRMHEYASKPGRCCLYDIVI
ncbi:MAG: putative quinol monooxygenase [Lachnospiraceae bacterium]|nr:putative quinol monooxygenase [Lachnospiraceae bacterium]